MKGNGHVNYSHETNLICHPKIIDAPMQMPLQKTYNNSLPVLEAKNKT